MPRSLPSSRDRTRVAKAGLQAQTPRPEVGSWAAPHVRRLEVRLGPTPALPAHSVRTFLTSIKRRPAAAGRGFPPTPALRFRLRPHADAPGLRLPLRSGFGSGRPTRDDGPSLGEAIASRLTAAVT